MSILRVKGTGVIARTAEPYTYEEEWVRPSDWLDLPTINDSEDKVVGLFAVFDDESNFVAVRFQGNYTVDWGDGTSENVNSNVTAQHLYDFNDANLDGTLTSRGYKQAIITITPNGGTLTSCELQIDHSGLSALSINHIVNWLDIQITGTNWTNMTVGGTTSQLRLCERVYIHSIGTENNLTNFFRGMMRLREINYFDVSGVVNTTSMFQDCTSIAKIPEYNFSSNLTAANTMFYNCFCLQSIHLFDTSNVSNFTYMFNNCRSLTEIPDFDTSNGGTGGTSLLYMFQGCSKLTKAPNLNTSNAVNTTNMFASCAALTSIPFYDLSNVIIATSMFQSCFALRTIPNLDLSSATATSSMFYNCYNLRSLPPLNISNSTNTSNMFRGCHNLRSIPEIDISKSTNTSYMFDSCVSLVSLPELNTSSSLNTSYMFSGCYSLKSVPTLDTRNSTTMTAMFLSCYALQTIQTEFSSSNVNNMSSMFYNCYSLEKYPIMDTSNVTIITDMFRANFCAKEIPAYDFSGVTTAPPATTFDALGVTRIKMTGLNQTFDIQGMSLGPDALDEVYTNLPTASAKTITVTGNWGVSSDDPSIATAKGWTVVG